MVGLSRTDRFCYLINPDTMKTNEKNLQEGTAFKKPEIKRRKSEELKTDPPLSEKDEVKRAEEMMKKNIRR
jgi:hypothetical protein